MFNVRITRRITGVIVLSVSLLEIYGCAHQPEPQTQHIHLAAADALAQSFTNENKQIEKIFKNAVKNTQRQSFWQEDGTVYVQTGDIPAEWLRDSSAQVRPYLFLAKDSEQMQQYFRGVIQGQAQYILIDPYANAFRANGGIWEQKWELDSLAYPVLLAWSYWKLTGDDEIFTETFRKAMVRLLDHIEFEQNHEANLSSYSHDELPRNGIGAETAWTGMIWSGFRPSDDACKYPYLIPSQMMMVVALDALHEMLEPMEESTLSPRVEKIRTEIDVGIQTHGIVEVEGFGKIYAYEVDGLGRSNLMDDANIPSLLSIPYVGYRGNDDPIYKNTRAWILSSNNPYFYEGDYASGIGSPHTPWGYVWPLALIMQGLTSSDVAEKEQMLTFLMDTEPGDSQFHESFDPDDPKMFTRKDFGWPNALFVEFYLTNWLGEKMLPLPSTL